MQYEKRRYQERIVENFEKWFTTNSKLSTVIIPAGSGKSLSASLCLNTCINIKILWVAHRRELIDQAYDTLFQVISWTTKISKEIGTQKADPNSDIIVGSVQTISKSRKHLKSFTPDIIIIDEYHHFAENNKTYKYLTNTWPDAKILGLTATPWRFSGDDLPLGEVLLEMDIGTAISHGYLVPLKPEILKSNTSLANVKTQMGDFAINELSKTINIEERNNLIIDKVVELVKSGRKGIVFAADVAHSKTLCELASKRGISTAEIYGETPTEERDKLVPLIRAGQIDCTFNNCCFLEGTDIPIWSFAVMARPTKSLGLYIQAIGRCGRKYPGKTDSIIVDVYDKLKVKQSRITFHDMAEHGDMFGERKRANNILTALLPTWKDIAGPGKNPENDHIAEKLINFPVFLISQHQDRWTTDDDFFPITSWVVAEGQRLITWTEEQEIIKIVEKTDWKPLTYKPAPALIKNMPIIVRHDMYGEGKIVDVGLGTEVKVDFVSDGWLAGENKFVPISELKVKHTYQDVAKEKDKKKIERVFYLCFPGGEDKGRLVEMTKSGKDLVVVGDQRLTKAEARSYVVSGAKAAGVFPLVRADAGWKRTLASEPQKKFIESLMFAGKIKFDLDIDHLTKGEASAIIEQTKWQKVIAEKFGAQTKDKLLGYDTTTEDV